MARSEMKKMKVACVALMAVTVMMMMSNAPKAQAAITCQMVAGYVSPCFPYLAQGSGTPPTNCCNGVRNLNNAARTTPDRQTACGCLKSLSGNLPQSGIAAAAGIPGKCKVYVPYKIDPKTDCSRVQ